MARPDKGSLVRNRMTVRLLLLVWLSLAQGFAPLLHAHWGQEGAPSVVHLPGLERYYHLGDRSPGVDPSVPLQDLEGVVVRADQGVAGSPPQAQASAVLLLLLSSTREGVVSFLPISPSRRFLLNALLPRAPPA